ncbi:hypothetical protein ASF71_15100 [Deinococcus sp. Leaf326]|nr:hypothetical protein ASF71_15100 [Deinococcus sp. Leaf326]
MSPTRLVLLTGILALTACSSTPTPSAVAPVATPPTQAAPKLGLVEIEFRGVGTQLQARALQPLTSQALTDTDRPCVVIGSSLSQSTVDLGGKRYMQATFPVTNNCATSLQNLTYVAVRRLGTNATLGDSAITSMKTFGATDAAVAIATQILPTQPVYVSRNTIKVDQATASLQVFDETTGGELATLQAQVDASRTTYDLLPYGFVTTTSSGGRVIPVGETGQVTFALSVPLQASAAQDVFSFRMLANATTNSVTTVTQGLEEQDVAGKAAVEARAAALSGSEIRTLLGPTLTPENLALNSSAVCRVRTAGPKDAPTATLVNAQGTLTVSPPKTPLIVGGTQLQPIPTLTVNGKAFRTGLVIQSLSPASLSVTNNLVHPVPSFPLTRQSGTVRLSTCQQTADVVMRTSPVVSLSAGGYHTLAVKPDGTVVAWGQNTYGQTNVPAGLSGVVAVSAGTFHSLALKSDGTVVAWGQNTNGQTNVPAGLSGVVAISAANSTNWALKADGTAFFWGGYAPDGLNALSDAVSISAGSSHELILKADGTINTSGSNSYGQRTVPAGLNSVINVASGNMHSVALRADGRVFAWGRNTSGQTSVPAGALSGVVMIAAGGEHTVALNSDGKVFDWGDSQASVPFGTVLSGVVAISTGMYHSVALNPDGTVYAWGRNAEGQLNMPANLKVMLP